eukprot:GHVU01223206.1.p1 GENE.GHVU01223206.1~~GHVU01223206.1.p1  ORF type:complete len:804 (-),score=30.71 GHVU01223206.1:344-2755(-)
MWGLIRGSRLLAPLRPICVGVGMAGNVTAETAKGGVMALKRHLALILGVAAGVSACVAAALVFILQGRSVRPPRKSAATATSRGTSPGSARRRPVCPQVFPLRLLRMLLSALWTPLLYLTTLMLHGIHCLSQLPRSRSVVYMLTHGSSSTAPPTPSPEFRFVVDTACSYHLGPRSGFRDAILHVWPTPTKYTMVRKDASFTTPSVVAVGFVCSDSNGHDTHVVLLFNLGPDDVPFLLKPRWLHLVPSPAHSWLVVHDYYGRERKLRVNAPCGTGGSNLPSFRWRPAGRSASVHACISSAKAGRVVTPEILGVWHARLLHPSAERLAGTLLEQGFATSTGEVKRLLGHCTLCARKNAAYRKVPRRRDREDREGLFPVGWDLAHMADRGFKGQHEISLLVHEDSMLWHAVALSKKSDAPDHLLQWIHELGPMGALRSDNAGELKGVRVQVICQENNIHMIPTPPHTSAVNGIVERAIRELRMFLAIVISVLGLPPSIWPALLAGICELHNKLYSPCLKSSPWLRFYGFPPRLAPLIGDYVVFRPPAARKQPKSLALPGKEMVYLGSANSSTSLVLDESTTTIVRVHPSQLVAFRPRPDGGFMAVLPGADSSAAVPLPTPSSLPPVAVTVPSSLPPVAPSVSVREPVRLPGPDLPPPLTMHFSNESSSSSSSGSSAASAVVDPPTLDAPEPSSSARRPSDVPDEAAALPHLSLPLLPPGPGEEEALPVVPSGRPPLRRSSRRVAGSPPASPRLARQCGVGNDSGRCSRDCPEPWLLPSFLVIAGERESLAGIAPGHRRTSPRSFRV